MHAWLIAALVVSWALVFALAGALVLLIRQHGELIMYQQDLDHRLEVESFLEGKRAERGEGAEPHGAEMQGLPIGSPAPEFALQTLDGAERTLADYRGKPFVLAFFADTCGYCTAMAPVIGQVDKKGRRLVLVSHGDKQAHEKMAAENRWHSDVLIEPEYEVMSSYMAMGTPSGYLIDDQGRIASKIALGADPVLDLLKAEPVGPDEDADAEASENGQGNGHVPGSEMVFGTPEPSPGAEQTGDEPQAAATGTATALKTRDVSESNVVRDGLPVGTEAPNFVLKDLEGKTHSLLDYRGKRVLLVFSDTHCGPCEAMSPGLVQLAEKNRKKLQVIMISRGDEEENRRKAEAFGFPFPVLRQKAWEISKLYGMFATPIGFLIDENGIIVKDVAAGPEPILELV